MDFYWLAEASRIRCLKIWRLKNLEKEITKIWFLEYCNTLREYAIKTTQVFNWVIYSLKYFLVKKYVLQ